MGLEQQESDGVGPRSCVASRAACAALGTAGMWLA